MEAERSSRKNHPPSDWTWHEGVGYLSLNGREIPYDRAYFENYVRLANTHAGSVITEARKQMVLRWMTWDARCRSLLDIGIGAGTFLRSMVGSGLALWGSDVNPDGIKWLEERNMGRPFEAKADILTFWDSMEHIPGVGEILDFHKARLVFVSMPIYRNEEHALSSKHFKPGEHCWYFTEAGLRRVMRENSYEILEMNQCESVSAGREDVWSFAFRRVGK